MWVVLLMVVAAVAAAGLAWTANALTAADASSDEAADPVRRLRRASDRALATAVALLVVVTVLSASAPPAVGTAAFTLAAVVGLGALLAAAAARWVDPDRRPWPTGAVIAAWVAAGVVAVLVVGLPAAARRAAENPDAATGVGAVVRDAALTGSWIALLVAVAAYAHLRWRGSSRSPSRSRSPTRPPRR